MFCTNCGAKNEPDAQFCTSCGHLMTSADDQSMTLGFDGEKGEDEVKESIPTPTAPVPVSEEAPEADAGIDADYSFMDADSASEGSNSSDENGAQSRPVSTSEKDTDDMADAEQPTATLSQNEQYMGVESEPSTAADSQFQTQALPNVTASVEQPVAVPVTRKVQRKTVIIWGVLIGVVVILIGAYFILKNMVFTPSEQIKTYVSAVSSGNYKRANQLVDPGVANDSRILLTNDYAKNADSRIKNVEIGPLVRNPRGSGYQVRISYTVNGVKQSKPLDIQAAGKQFLIFDSWRIATPLTTTIKVAAPKTVDSLVVNGINVKLAEAGMNKEVVTPPSDSSSSDSSDEMHYSSMDQYTLPVYPGVAKVELPNSKYIQAQQVKLDGSSKVAYIAPQATDALEKGILDQVQQRINECTASTETNKTGCSFSNGTFEDYGGPSYTNIKRTVSSQPSLSELDLSNGEFKTSLIQTNITYQYRFDSESDWEDGRSSASDCLTGTFVIKDGELAVKIDDSGKNYY